MATRAEEEATIEELRQVLSSNRFATVHDIVRSAGLAELAEGSKATSCAGHGDESEALPQLPSRR